MTWARKGAFELGAVHATARYLNHPGIALGYRLEADGAAFVYATDHEPHSPYPRLGDSTATRCTTRTGGTSSSSRAPSS